MCGGKPTEYIRLVKEGSKTYRYGYLDKVLSVREGGKRRTFTYHADGQLATATRTGGPRSVATGTGRAASPLAAETETFLWDGLALIRRGCTSYVNEPHPNGGSPILSSKDGVMFSDILGTTLGADGDGGYAAASLTAFGDPVPGWPRSVAADALFTGKPHVDGLGYAFLFRNYRPGLGKWQTADPLGYPDGWNRLAYCENCIVSSFDSFGTERFDYAWELLFGHWLGGNGAELDVFFDGYFTDYMNSNRLLNNQIRYWIWNYIRGFDGGLINMRRHAVIENGYTTGYELLHGSNGEVGDFQMSGGFTTHIEGAYKIYNIDLVCTWNDIIDPNHDYVYDTLLEWFVRRFSETTPYDYVVRIKWNKHLILRELYE